MAEDPGRTAAPRRILILALGAFVLSLAVAGCGGPGNGVARVGDAVITKSSFDHWLGVAAKASRSPGAAGTVGVPDAPKFTKCVAQRAQQQGKPAKGQPQQTPAQFRSQCEQQYARLRDQVMSYLISAQWIQGEASDQGIEVSDEDVTKAFKRQRQQSFPKQADFQKFLKSSGMSLEDLKLQVKLGLLRDKLRAKVAKGKKVTDKQIAAYYNRNRGRPPIAQPARRDLLAVLTKTQANANQAKAALQGGTSFATVAKQFSIDPTTKAQGAKLTISKGQQQQTLDAAFFAAKPGQLTGPVKAGIGYYVFRVTKETPGSQQSLAQAKATIRRLLQTQGQQTALQKFVKKFEKKWKSRTKCHRDFRVMTCKNAAKQTAQQRRALGAAPQQGGGARAPGQ